MAAARQVVVAGGGVTGLATAYRVLATAKASGAPVEVTLLEARATLGGNIRTERAGDLIIDGGPDAWVVAKPHASALCKELGLGDRLVVTTEKNRRLYVGHGGRLHVMPEGVLLGVPTQLYPFAASPILSVEGKARAALDLVIPRRKSRADESIASFIRRRLGAEVLERIAEPLLGGIYAGDPEQLGIRATFPDLADMEERHGSLIRGAVERMAARGRRAAGRAPSPFHALAGGSGELIDALRDALTRLGARVLLGARVEAISRPRGGVLAPPSPRYLVRVDGSAEPLPADHLVLACPAYAAAAALEALDRELAGMLSEIRYLSTATVVLAYRRADVPHPLDAVGVIFPAREGRKILATTFVDSKWPGRAPADAALLRVFVGGHRDPAALDRDDGALVSLARAELADVLRIRAAPTLTRVFRFERSNPQPVVGHADRVRRLRLHAARLPGLHLAGAAYDGVGIPDCVRQANEVARAIARG